MTGPWTFPSPTSLDWYLTNDDARGGRMEEAHDRGKAELVRCNCRDGLAEMKQNVEGII